MDEECVLAICMVEVVELCGSCADVACRGFEGFMVAWVVDPVVDLSIGEGERRVLGLSLASLLLELAGVTCGAMVMTGVDFSLLMSETMRHGRDDAGIVIA